MRITTVIRSNPRTGRLVRSVIVTPTSVDGRAVAGAVAAPSAVAPPAALNAAVERIAAEHAVSPRLIHSVIRAESNYDPGAVSPKGALGLMQLIPATARRFGVSDALDPLENIQGGVKYLRYLLDLYDGDYPLVLAAYNAGEGAVTRYGGVPPFPETRNYLQRVARNLEQTRPAAGKSGVANPAPPAVKEAGPAGPNHIVEIVEPDGSVRYVSR
jgi:soluble lytic murein transglycosylase-like protein